MSVDLKFVFHPKQTLNNVSIHSKAYLPRFIDEIIIPTTVTFLDIVKREKMHKINKNRSQSVFYPCNINKQ